MTSTFLDVDVSSIELPINSLSSFDQIEQSVQDLGSDAFMKIALIQQYLYQSCTENIRIEVSRKHCALQLPVCWATAWQSSTFYHHARFLS